MDIQVGPVGCEASQECQTRALDAAAMVGDETGVVGAQAQQVEGLGITPRSHAKREVRKGGKRGGDAGLALERIRGAAMDVGCRRWPAQAGKSRLDGHHVGLVIDEYRRKTGGKGAVRRIFVGAVEGCRVSNRGRMRGPDAQTKQGRRQADRKTVHDDSFRNVCPNR